MKLNNLQPDEKIIMVLRRDKIYYFKHLLVLIILVALPIISYYLLNLSFPNLFFSALNTLYILTVSAYFLAIMVFSLISWMNFYLNVWIITNERIIEFEQKSLFKRETSELILESVEDVTTKVNGLMPSAFSYGNVYVQTAATQERFIFSDAPKPDQVKETIIGLCQKSHHQQ